MAELLLFCEAFVCSFLFTGFILRFSLRKRLFDIPNDRSSHETPKPRLGGLALTCAFFVSAATLLLVRGNPFHSTANAVGVLAGGALLALVGLCDDLRGLDARFKLAVQLAAAALAVASGVVLSELKLPLVGSIELGPLSVPFTVLWIVGVINFYNFIDGIDGLAAGIGVIASLFLLVIGQATGAPALGGMYAILAGSSFGFLRYNFPPARIFMGDMGSTFVGFMFAVLAVVGSKAGIPVFVTLLLLGTVIGDAALTLIRRIVGREKIFAAHRTHYYQRLTSLGLSHKQVTLLEYLVVVLLGISAFFTFGGDRIFVTFFAVIWVGFFLWVLAKVRSMERGGKLFWEGGVFATAIGDILFIAASYVLSYYLRLSFRFPQAETASLLISLPIVLIIRTVIFYYYGLYRGIWKYTTFDDLMRIVKAVSLSSAVMVVSFTLLFRFRAFPRSVFIIDWFILTVFMAGSRIATRWFHELPAKEEITGKRIAIGGTGPVAEAILHHVKKAHGMIPVGFFDDRSEMAGRLIHGLEVLGPFTRICELARRFKIDEIIVMSSIMDRLPPERLEGLRDTGVRVRVITDPSLVASLPEIGPAGASCEDMRVMAAGNGDLVEFARSIFPGAESLVLVSNDSRILFSAGKYGPPDGKRCETYLGILDDDRALGTILERYRPEVVLIDFAVRFTDVCNPVEGYLRTVLLPTERLARAVARRSGMRLVAFCRHEALAGSELGNAVLMNELVLIDAFRNEPERLSVVRAGGDMPLAHVLGIVEDVMRRDGAVYRCAKGDGGALPSLVKVAEPERSPEIAALLAELTRGLDIGDPERINTILDRFKVGAAVGKHE